VGELCDSLGSKYTDKERMEVIAHYAVLGNQTKVSELTNIPQQTISQWSKNEWWQEALSRVRLEKAEELDAMLTNSIHKALDQVQDRIDNGDEIIQSGQALRRKMTGKDLATTAGILFDKRQISRNLPTSISAKTDDAKLLELQAKFEALAGKTIDGEVVD